MASVENDSGPESFYSSCQVCSAALEVPWIRCVKCQPNLDICTRCFSYGAEIGQHESDHPYTVVKLDFPLFEASWTAAEELRLLDAIQEYGLGNWPAVSNRMRTKSAQESERHYFSCYVDKPQPPLPEFEDRDIYTTGAPVTFKLSDNPPRPPEGSSTWVELGGYSAARSDFNYEYDNYIEMDIARISFSDDEDVQAEEEGEEMQEEDKIFYKDLNLAVLDVYRNSLLERQRRKKIIRDYGLINLRKWYVYFRRRYDFNFALDCFRPFMKLFPCVQFDKYLESLLYEKQLKSEISRLQEYRRHGITKLRSVKQYYVLKQRREDTRARKNLLTDILNHVKDEMFFQNWLAKQAAKEGSNKGLNMAIPPLNKRTAQRLQIDGLPGYDKLNEAEKELCSEARLVPDAYLEFSKLLISECAKSGFLRLAQARTLIKIDVNKTRKLYDFLVSNGQINKEPP
ncbi:transcriptional adapter 2-alpha-like [Physella acuta]|uniref:transcriptional adapter 2-alpha-like n=1 Tax=Physella acuta TaxID=109671 RepID=UPI0027DD0ACA|nr:transcriptional adapter 2-alpha-like [Physella acuta]